MRYTTASAFRSALEQRLLTLAQETGIPLIRLRKLVVFDRIMARLLIVAPDRWLLKGAVALLFRAGPQFRTTKDLDLGRQDSEEAATADFLVVQSIETGDYFSFSIRRAKQPDSEEGTTARYHVTAELAGRLFEDITVDIGFGDPMTDVPELIQGPALLSFADISPVKVPTLPIEQHTAEKIHAYTRRYAGFHSTRVKDLIDLVLISSHFSLQAERLYRALHMTFTSRRSHSLPIMLPAPPTQWHPAYRKMAAEIGIDRDLNIGYERARAFLDPILANAVHNNARWNALLGIW